MGTDARRSYTAEQKAKALDLYIEHGAAEAERRCDVPSTTIRKWAERAGLTNARANHATAATEAARKTWAQRKSEVALLAGAESEAIVRQMLETPSAQAKAYLARAFALMVDKTQLLEGGATGRVEVSTAEEREQRVHELRDEVAARRAKRAG